MRICICGGGNTGHVMAGYLASQGSCEVHLLTRHPEMWAHELTIHTPDGTDIHGRIGRISANATEVVGSADMVLLCLPGYSIGSVLTQVAPALRPGVAVGSVVSCTGFFDEAQQRLPSDTPLFGFQRVPFVSRLETYGHSAHLLGTRPLMRIGTKNVADKDSFGRQLSALFRIPTEVLSSHYEASISNSNPILHPARLYSMWKDWKPGTVYARNSAFYAEWTDKASALYIAMDRELHELIKALPVSDNCLPTVLDYYESHDASSLTRKLRSIAAFRSIMSPMRQTAEGFVPDTTSRYFSEDFPYGLDIIRRLAAAHHIPTPTMDMIAQWGRTMIQYATDTP